MLRIAIQKSGRLHDESAALLKECGLRFAGADRKLVATVDNFALEILYLRDDDIPQYVADGVADIGIVGENVLYESQINAELKLKLGFGKCRLSLAIKKDTVYDGIKYFDQKNVATSYPNLLAKWATNNSLTIKIHQISGSVEIAPGLGLSDAICDLVSSGSTLISNGLKEAEVILKSEAVLIAHKALNADKQEIFDKLIFRINSVLKAGKHKYILLNAPEKAKNDIINILPGMKSPTIVPLAQEGWCSIHTVIEEDRFWEIIEKLKNAGAEGILVVPIEKMIL
ncbi:MAG: ATP phosphoribosyltransferase [Cytophagales bacterium]|nr:ATP phosphoribosyltransferase [Cytophagales bacterium]